MKKVYAINWKQSIMQFVNYAALGLVWQDSAKRDTNINKFLFSQKSADEKPFNTISNWNNMCRVSYENYDRTV